MMPRSMLAASAALLTFWPMAVAGQAGSKQSPSNAPDGPDIVVNGVRDIVVNGRARHCTPLAGDPLDKVNVTPFDGKPRLSEVVPVGTGRFALEANDERITGPDFWQRVGVGIDQYVFRAPRGGRPMCIGGRMPDRGDFAGFRRITDATPFHGKRIRFTAWVATGEAHAVTFFLAAGYKQRTLYNGGNTNNRPLGGNHGWTPVLLEIGPVPDGAAHISYGFHLHGPGDVWVYKPKLEIVTDEPPQWRKGDFTIIGTGKR